MVRALVRLSDVMSLKTLKARVQEKVAAIIADADESLTMRTVRQFLFGYVCPSVLLVVSSTYNVTLGKRSTARGVR